MMQEMNDKTLNLVNEYIEKIRPYLRKDGGDIEVISVDDGIVYVKMLGACVDCSALDVTIKEGIESMLVEYVPGIIGVEVIS